MIFPLVPAAIALLWLFKDQSHPGSYFFFLGETHLSSPSHPSRVCDVLFVLSVQRFHETFGLFSLTFGHLFNVEMHVLCFWIDVSFASWVIYPLHALSFSPRLEYPLAEYWTPAC